MNDLVAISSCVLQFKSPADLSSAWHGADERAHADGAARSFTNQRSVKEVEKEALELLRGDEISKRASGVVLLGSMARVCSSNHFMERCANWIQQLVQHLDKNGPTAQAGIAQLLRQLVLRASEFPSLTSSVAQLMSNMVDKLVKASPEWRKDALLCLNACMQCYPSLCLNSKSKIIDALLPLLDVSEECIQDAVAQCMASAPSIGSDTELRGGQLGNAATAHAEVWLQWCNMLLATLNDTMDKLVSPLEQVHTPLIGVHPLPSKGVTATASSQGQDGPQIFPLVEAPDNEPNRSALLLTRCQTLCCCIKALLQTAYPVAISFPLQGCLTVACRILALTSQQVVTHPSLECVLLFSAMPAFYSSAVDLLTAIACSCKQNLMPQSWLMNQVLLQVFNWTGADSANHTTPYSRVRIASYRLLEAWVWVVGSGLDPGSAMHFVKHILNDAKPLAKDDKVEMQKSAKDKDKNDKGKDKDSSEAPAIDAKDIDVAANPELTLSALKALSALVEAVGRVLTPECHKAIRLFLAPVILLINNAHLPSSGLPAPKGWWTAGNAPVPYGRADCRKELYRALLSCVLADERLTAMPLNTSVRLFRSGITDPNMEVSLFCRHGLQVCNLIAHPRVPTVSSSTPLTSTLPPSARGLHPAAAAMVAMASQSARHTSSASTGSSSSGSVVSIAVSSGSDGEQEGDRATLTQRAQREAGEAMSIEECLQMEQAQLKQDISRTAAAATTPRLGPAPSGPRRPRISQGLDQPKNSSILQRRSQAIRQSQDSATSESSPGEVGTSPLAVSTSGQASSQSPVTTASAAQTSAASSSAAAAASSQPVATKRKAPSQDRSAVADEGDQKMDASPAGKVAGATKSSSPAAQKKARVSERQEQGAGADKPATQASSNVSSMLESFVDSGPDSDSGT